MSSHRQSASDEWTTRASNSFDDDTPSTPDTSAFSSVASPAQSLRDKTKSSGRDSNQLDPRFLPQRGSSKMVQEVTGSMRRTRLSPQASREYLISRVQDVDTSSPSTGDIQSKRSGRHWPLGGPAFLDGESQIATESLAALPPSVSGPEDDFFEHSMRDRLMSAPSVPVMHENSSVQYRSKDISKATNPSTARSRSIGDLLPPLPNLDYESKPLPQLPVFAKPERKIHYHKRNVATVGDSSTVPSTQSSTSLRNADPHRRRLHSRVPPPISIPKQPPNISSTSIPLSPRTVRPSSPPNIPLPADPPVPPSRASSYRTIVPQASNASSESLVDPALTINCSTQDTRRTIRSRPALRRNFSEYTLSNHEEVVPGTSYSAPLSLASSARASRIDQSDESTGHDPTIPAGDCNDAQNATVPSSPSCTASIFKPEFNTPRHNHGHGHGHGQGPSSLSRQSSSHSRSHPLSPPVPLSPDQLESRVAFLERQNKMLQAALIAALDVGAGVGVGVAVGHDTDSARTSGSMKVGLSSACVSRSDLAAGSGSGSGSRSASFVGEAGERDGTVLMR